MPFAAILDEQQRIPFQNEARAAATLDHPHIVRIHAVGVDRGIHYFAMQYIEGQSLTQLLHDAKSRSGYCLTNLPDKIYPTKPTPSDASIRHTDHNPRGAPREPNNADDPTATADTTPQLQANLSTQRIEDRTSYYRSIARLGVQIAEALQHAHERGIIHRDIKPANIMLDAHGRAVITDFGLARFEGEVRMTMTGNVVGTLRYAAPEQLLGDRAVVDERVDVYSLGVTLYELLTMRPPFDGEARERLLQQVAFGAAKAPRAIDSSIPIDLETIVLKAIEKQPDQRYSSAAALADDLRRFLQQRPIIARPPSLVQHVTKWLQRNPATAGLLAFALMTAMLCFAMLSLHSYRGMRREAQLRQEAQDAARRAQAYSQVAQQTIDDFLSEFAKELEEQPDVGVVSQRLYLRAMEMYKLLLAQSATNSPLRLKAAEAYLKAAQQMWNRGQFAEATQLMELATDSYRALVHDEPAEPSHRIKLAGALNSLAVSAMNQLDYASGFKQFKAAMALVETPAGDSQDVERLATLARCHEILGEIYWRYFETAASDSNFAQSSEYWEQVCRLRQSDDDLFRLGQALSRRGVVARYSNRGDRSEQYLTDAMQLFNQRVKDLDRNHFQVTYRSCRAKLQLAI